MHAPMNSLLSTHTERVKRENQSSIRSEILIYSIFVCTGIMQREWNGSLAFNYMKTEHAYSETIFIQPALPRNNEEKKNNLSFLDAF
jgi:hypothetical protein